MEKPEFLISLDIDPMDYMLPEGFNVKADLLSEAEYAKVHNKLTVELLDVNRYIKENNIREITNPVSFVKEGAPTPDGLLSNDIFGITKEDRAGTFGYINLGDLFLDPSCYKIWCKVDSRIKSIVHQTEKYIITEAGDFEVSDKGKTGVKFLKDNFDKIVFKRTDSNKRDIKIEYLQKNKDRMFINKYIVIPAYYRDVNNNGARVGIGAINKLYASLIMSSQSLISTKDYGFDNTGAISGRIQETIVTIYDWFVGNNNDRINDEGVGISKKKGIMKRANLSKTSDYSSRLVISAPELKVETVDDLMVNLERSAMPLSAAIADFYWYILFNIKRFFENEFGADTMYPVLNSAGKLEYHRPKDPLIEFSDERIKKELKRFLHGQQNRFIPIEVPLEDTKGTYYMKFKGRKTEDKDIGNQPGSIYNRRLTWCDVFYMAAVESTKDKTLLITRFPIDSYFNQFPTNIVVSSTKVTEPMYINEIYYPWYPLIKEEDIGSNTSSTFVDTMIICNLFLPAIGGDYDGDQVTAKGAYTVEANEELQKHIKSKKNFISVGCDNIRTSSKDSLQAIYNLTLVLSDTELIDPIF